MKIVDRVFALRGSHVFAALRESELVLIAASAADREFGPGETISPGGQPLRHLYVIVDGEVRCGERELPKAFGAPSLLFGVPMEAAVVAGSTGARCLLIRRAHFHTIVRECPGLVVGLLRGDEDGPARAA